MSSSRLTIYTWIQWQQHTALYMPLQQMPSLDHAGVLDPASVSSSGWHHPSRTALWRNIAGPGKGKACDALHQLTSTHAAGSSASWSSGTAALPHRSSPRSPGTRWCSHSPWEPPVQAEGWHKLWETRVDRRAEQPWQWQECNQLFQKSSLNIWLACQWWKIH